MQRQSVLTEEDFKKYNLLESNLEHVYHLLYANQVVELKPV